MRQVRPDYRVHGDSLVLRTDSEQGRDSHRHPRGCFLNLFMVVNHIRSSLLVPVGIDCRLIPSRDNGNPVEGRNGRVITGDLLGPGVLNSRRHARLSHTFIHLSLIHDTSGRQPRGLGPVVVECSFDRKRRWRVAGRKQAGCWKLVTYSVEGLGDVLDGCSSSPNTCTPLACPQPVSGYHLTNNFEAPITTHTDPECPWLFFLGVIYFVPWSFCVPAPR